MPANSRSKNGVALLRLCRGHPRLYVATKQIRGDETNTWRRDKVVEGRNKSRHDAPVIQPPPAYAQAGR
jgi:hypothetical protein